ncbi:fungal-specific transcription factor domain-containing protein [Xylariaceae sp. FL1019]|nr:fungal-specific transcription factor domain-containing protein [Xylariaceae sp. FL1019]
MSAVKIRSSQGCWTCRLRRKKCDEIKPICTICNTLEISCFYSDKKPDWLDGGVGEKQMTDDLKAMVKQKANERRERKWTHPDLDASPSENDQHRHSHLTIRAGEGPSPSDEGTADEHGSSNNGTDDISTSQAETGPSSNAALPLDTRWSTEVNSISVNLPTFPNERSEIEVIFTMIYLDYVVPFLFPFYRPCLVEQSRGWMLAILMKNRTLFHTALSLANWLYAVILESAEGGHSACRTANWTELQKQQEIAMNAMQQDIQSLNERGIANSFTDCISCLQSMIQLLEFEVAMAHTTHWQIHLDAAIILFDQLIVNHASSETTEPWNSVQDRMSFPLGMHSLKSGRKLLTSDQSSFRFYTAYLLWLDIVAATARGEAPRLQKYHPELLEGDSPAIHLSEYVGCHNWVMIEISNVARLAARKREHNSKGSLSMDEIVQDACAIKERIRRRMNELEPFSTARMSNIFDPSSQAPVMPYSSLSQMFAQSGPPATPAQDLHSRVWAQATITYLTIVVSGLQPSLPEMQMSVQATIEMFRGLQSPLVLRTMIWPFAVTGCMSPAEDQNWFTEAVNNMGPLQAIGTVKESLSVIQEVWKHRQHGCVEPSMASIWDLATCFSVLGHPSLLV